MRPSVIVESTTNGVRLHLEHDHGKNSVMFGPTEIGELVEALKSAMAHCGQWTVTSCMVPVKTKE